MTYSDPKGLEVEVLVGGSHWYEHAALRIDGTVYSNGRYRVPGQELSSFGMVGPNVLTVQNASSYYETSDHCKTCNTNGYVLNVTEQEQERIEQFYQKLINSSSPHPNHNGWYVMDDQYRFIGNNCSSLVVEALNAGLPWYHTMSLP